MIEGLKILPMMTYIGYLLNQIPRLRKNEITAKDLLPHNIDKSKLDDFSTNMKINNKWILNNLVYPDKKNE